VIARSSAPVEARASCRIVAIVTPKTRRLRVRGRSIAVVELPLLAELLALPAGHVARRAPRTRAGTPGDHGTVTSRQPLRQGHTDGRADHGTTGAERRGVRSRACPAVRRVGNGSLKRRGHCSAATAGGIGARLEGCLGALGAARAQHPAQRPLHQDLNTLVQATEGAFLVGPCVPGELDTAADSGRAHRITSTWRWRRSR
jgi:hypothetical protein